MNTEQLDKAVHALTYPCYGGTWFGTKIITTDDFKAARGQYNIKKAMLEQDWKYWLGDHYAGSFPTRTQDLIFQKAWEQGHSSGYYEVENHYIDYAEFADQVIELQ